MRDEHLPAHALARALVEGVGDDADDLDVQFRVGTAAEPEPLADRALALEEVVRELAVHDRDPEGVDEVPSDALASLCRKSRPSSSGIPIVSK